ncbi:glycosyltransferase [Actinoallomurus iriomotensis]|uniref:Glycosyl transferase n=1 Tax=Actinoallomurus iriomotensis TaxID=478107 RepID=A0A9W6RGW6_9ACTN|nr:glycosyltransferase [Actinoallomurus iriomotensis]GLY74430.1 glycosyl transferase [Actinoallomurus iriomotensis]
MNIVMVSVHTNPVATEASSHEGVRVHVAELARELGRQGHRVTIYTRRDGLGSGERVRLAPRVNVEFISAGNALPMSEQEVLPHIREFADKLAKRLVAGRPDVIHAHHWLSGLVAMSAADGLDIPIVQSFHGLASLRRGGEVSPARLRVERAISRSVDALVATTETECDELTRLGVTRKRIACVPSGVDSERFTPQGRTLLPRSENPRIVMLSRRFAEDGVTTAIKALSRIPDAELVVAGGPAPDELDGDPGIHRLRIAAKEAGVDERVTFLGRVDPDDVPGLLRSADLTVSLPSYQSFGRVPVESMACGTPVVVTPVGGHLDTVIDDVTGVYARPGRPAELAQRIRNLLAERTHLTALGIGGADRVRARYSWERVANETLKAYESVLPAAEPEQDVHEEEELELAVAS